MGAQDHDPEADFHAYLPHMVIRCGLSSDPHYHLPFVVHAFPETGTRLQTMVSYRVSLIKYKGHSPHVHRKSRPILFKK